MRRALVLAIDQKPFNDILFEGHDARWCRHAAAAVRLLGHAQGDAAETLPGFGADLDKSRAEARKIMEKLRATTKDKPLKIKVATRNIAIYRDPAVILIDQLKTIYIEGELEPIDTTVWYNKIQRKDYSGRHEPDRRRHRRSRRQFLRELPLELRPQLHRPTRIPRSTS